SGSAPTCADAPPTDRGLRRALPRPGRSFVGVGEPPRASGPAGSRPGTVRPGGLRSPRARGPQGDRAAGPRGMRAAARPPQAPPIIHYGHGDAAPPALVPGLRLVPDVGRLDLRCMERVRHEEDEHGTVGEPPHVRPADAGYGRPHQSVGAKQGRAPELAVVNL